jgi:RyR domain
MHSKLSVGYQPQPITLDGIEVAEELTGLIEALAKHVHDLWALQRLADGWTLGEKRDDTARTHPCLVRYEDLPESEKAYDRNVVLGTVRAVIALGFTISKTA